MNLDQVQSAIQARFPNCERVKDAVFRAQSVHKESPFATWLFDCTENILSEQFDIQIYKEELLRDEFYRIPGSMQWNLYCFFLCDENKFDELYSRGIVENVEADRDYARKFVRTPRMMRDDFTSLETVVSDTSSAMPDDISALWENKLSEQGFSCVFSDLSYAETVRRIKAGKDIDTSSYDKTKLSPEDEHKIEFVEAMHLLDFRHRPRLRAFTFGDCNLVHGVNGSGKTSLLEAIEAWMCGKNFRNPSDSVPPESIALKIRGVSDLRLGPESDMALYRNRDHLWYGNYQARKNDLCFNFARFNFFNSDAGARLEISKDDKEIDIALSRLVLGESATRISERMDKLLESLKKEEREYDVDTGHANDIIRTARENMDSLQKPTHGSEQAFKNLSAQLSLLGWKGQPPSDTDEGMLSLLDSINEITAKIETITANVRWMQKVSPMALKGERRLLEAFFEKNSEITTAINDLEKEMKQLPIGIQSYEKQLNLLKRKIAYTEAGAHELLGLEDRLSEIEKRKASLQAANKEISRIDFSNYAQVDETASEMEVSIQKELKKKEKLVAEKRETVASLEAIHGRIARLHSEIRAKAEELLEEDADIKSCPVCGANYKEGELLDLVRTRMSHFDMPELQKAHTSLEGLRKETESLNKVLRDLDVLQSVSIDAMEIESPGQVPVKILAEKMMMLDQIIAKCSVNLQKYHHDREKYQSKSFTEQELVSLNTAIEESFPGLSNANTHDLKQMKEQVQQKHSVDRNRNLQCGKDISALRKKQETLLNQHFSPDLLTLDQARKRQSQSLEAIERLASLHKEIELKESRPLSDVTLRLKTLREAIEGYLRLRQQEETVNRVIKENQSKIKAAQGILEEKRPVQDRLKKSIATIESLLKDHGAARYVQEFFVNNLEQISHLFRMIHAPREFDKIIWHSLNNVKGIRAIRKHDSAAYEVSYLSSGQRNALSLSIFLTLNRKLVKGPSIIILDDPVAHVDDLNIASFLDYLREYLLRCKRQIFFSTASTKAANLFQKKFDYLGKDNFREFELSP